MSLFERIKKFGYEIEYPIEHAYNIIDRMGRYDYVLSDKYSCHEDGLGIEFSTPTPASTIERFIEQINEVYEDIAMVVDKYGCYVNEWGFDCNDSGVHIRIDVSDWTKFERFVFTSFFSEEMGEYRDFVDWVESHSSRDWNNWNNPAGLYYMWRFIFGQDYANGSRSDRYNIRYEREYFGGGIYTIEMRMFAVKEKLDHAIDQVGFVEMMCTLVDKVLKKTDEIKSYDDFNIKLLYEVWKENYGKEE